MNIKLEAVFFILTGIMFLFGTVWIFKTEQRLKRFFMGKKGKDLEDNLISLQDEILKLKIAKENIQKDISTLYDKSKKSISGLETLRFNPFPDQGSNQSFAISMLNEEKDGVVISSLYSRERMSVFAKPIKKGKSEYELSDEEKEVLDKTKVS